MNDRSFGRQTWAVWPLLAAVLFCGTPTAPGQQVQADAAGKKLRAANGLLQRELFKEAIQEYEEFLAKYPAHADASLGRYGLALCHYKLNEHAKAAGHLQELVKDRNFKQRDDALALLGDCLLATRDYGVALKTFDDLLKDHPQSKHVELAALNRAQVLYLLGKPQESLAACRKFLKDYPSSDQRGAAEYFVACSQQAMGKHDEAEKSLRQFLKTYKDSPHLLDASLLLGQCLENQKRFDEAVEQYQGFIKKAHRERKGEGYYSLGLVLYKAGKYTESIEELSGVLSKSKSGDSQYAAPARLQLGLAQLAAGRPGDARKTLTDVRKLDSQRAVKARYWLAQCDVAEQKFQGARDALDALSKAKPAPENLDAVLYDRAICDMELGKFELAGNEFADFRKQYPASEQATDALYRQAFCLHKLTNYADSQALCEEVAKKKGPAKITAAAAELSAENLFLMGKHGEAARQFEQLLGAAGDQERKLRFTFRLGQCAFLSGDYPKAIGLLKQVASAPEAAKSEHLREAAFFLGDAQFQAKQYADAAKALDGYLSGKGQRREEAQFKLGLSQLRAGNPAEAEKTLGSLIDAPADSPWVMRAMLAYGQMAYHDLHKPDKAAKVLKSLEKLLADKTNKAPEELAAPTAYLLAWIDFGGKQYSQAGDKFADVVKRFAGHELAPDAAIQQAVCYKEMGQIDKAIELLEAFSKSYKTSERRFEARHLIGTYLALLNKHDEAIKVFSDLAGDKETEAVLYELAWSQRAAKGKDNAIKTYRKLLDKFPSGKLAAPARTELAELLYQDKKYDEAQSLAEKVIADDKSDAKTRAIAQYWLGRCLADTSQPAKAAEAFVALVEKYPSHELVPAAMHEAGVCLAGAKNLDDAKKWLELVLDKHPGSDAAPLARLELGKVQASAGEYDKSAETYQSFLDKHADSKFKYLAQFGIGWAMENQKKYDDARRKYLEVVESHNGPTAARAQFQIGECYFAEKQYDKAAVALLNVADVYAYPEWSARALYEAGRAFEKLGKLDQAKTQYSECMKKYKDSDVAALAKERLKALEEREK